MDTLSRLSHDTDSEVAMVNSLTKSITKLSCFYFFRTFLTYDSAVGHHILGLNRCGH